MNNESVQITPEDLRSSASQIRTRIAKMKDNLDAASNEMTKTQSSFESSAADTLRTQYETLKSKFGTFYEKMEDYAKFLDNTASEYETTDANIKKAANEVLES